MAVFALVLCLGSVPAWATSSWIPVGPEGGDVRSLGYDPQNPDRIFLGTSTGTLFLSNDGGGQWQRWVHFYLSDDYVLDHILVDPRDSNRIYVAAWNVQNQPGTAGGLFRSRDGGGSWEEMPALHDKPVHALAMAPSNPGILVAGALDGVFRSRDGGGTWIRISPAGEFGQVHSVAIDPRNPDVIYAGTFHLPWKTEDGGVHWHRISAGMSSDSDIFSFTIDPADPAVVYASACSGVYKSENGGELFHKMDIPYSARRARMVRQDPANPSVVYAGTTEGLWKSTDAGASWQRASGPELIVNDVLLDRQQPQRVVLATDYHGVLISQDAAATFAPSNRGFSHRYVTAVVPDRSDPQILYVSVASEKSGVFVSHDRGRHWALENRGLEVSDVLALKQAETGVLVAGTGEGVYVWSRATGYWQPRNRIAGERNARLASARVYRLALTPDYWLAATSEGLFKTTNDGLSWDIVTASRGRPVIAVGARGAVAAAATATSFLVSEDSGARWREYPMSGSGTRDLVVVPVADPAGAGDPPVFLAVGRDGAFRSLDRGAHWERVANGLPEPNVNSITYDESSHRLLATCTMTSLVFESEDAGSTWRRGPDSGYPLRRVSVAHGRLFGAASFDGVVLEP
jgi:photosystem II stability/assembly factor-like uncharacterized protein